MNNPLKVTLFSLLVGVCLPSALKAAPEISEFMAGGSSAPADADGDTPDWIEIHNPNTEAVNLAGYTLTDDQEVLGKWAFPGVMIEPDSYLLVFASGKDRAEAGDELHTSFELAGGGEYLALVDSVGTVVSDFDFPNQFGDVSYGTFGDTLQFFKTPTPSAANAQGLLGFVEDTKFSVDRGFHNTSFTLEITTATEGAEIFYSVDGSDPSTGSIFNPAKKYTEPLTIDSTTVVRAVAKKNKWQGTNTDTHTYMFLDDVVKQPEVPEGFPERWDGREKTVADYEMDPRIVDANADKIRDALLSLPTVSLVANQADFFGSKGIYTSPNTHGIEVAASAEWINSDGSTEFQVDCGARIQGGYFRQASATGKHSFRLLFKSEYGVERLRHDIFNEPGATEEFDTFVFRAGGNDGYAWGGAGSTVQFTRDEFGRRLALDAGHVSPRGKFVHMYVNGLYWGLYNFTERPNEDFSSSYLGGDSDNWDSVNSGDAKNGSLTDWRDYVSAAKSAESFEDYMALRGLNVFGDRDPDRKVYLDQDHYTEYMIINLWGGNWDWPNKNFWFGRQNAPESSGFKHYVWDFENTMGNNRGRSPLNMVAPRNTQWVGEPYAALRDLLWFQVAYADRVQRLFFNGGLLTPAKLVERYQAMADEIEMSIYAETARWGDDNRGTPYTIDEWQDERDWMLETYLPARSAIVLKQFQDNDLFPDKLAPVYSQHGGIIAAGFELTFSQNEGSAYYTVDDSDPFTFNANTGNIELSESATKYEGPITLNETTTVKSRWYQKSIFGSVTWSALNEAIFTVGTDGLLVTEIMYHPTSPTEAERATGFTSSSQFEYLVLSNIGESVADLNGVAFTNGIGFPFAEGATIAAGGTAILVRDQAAFESRYGTSHSVFGVYTGKLADNGETLTLSDPTGLAIHQFRYDDAEPWPISADGGGATLALVNPYDQPDSSKAESWGEGTALGGGVQPGGDSTLDGWLSDNNLNSATADSDGDGVINLAEYGLGSNPNAANGASDGLYPLLDGDFLTVSYPLRKGARDVLVSVEMSDDLTAWSAATGFSEQSRVAQGTDRELITLHADAPTVLAQYLRLVITLR